MSLGLSLRPVYFPHIFRGHVYLTRRPAMQNSGQSASNVCGNAEDVLRGRCAQSHSLSGAAWFNRLPALSQRIICEMPENVDKLAHMSNGAIMVPALGRQREHGLPHEDLGAFQEALHATAQARIADARQRGDKEALFRIFVAMKAIGQIANHRGRVCEYCWMPRVACICVTPVGTSAPACRHPNANFRVASAPDLPRRIRIWLYMHTSEYVRINNSGKLLVLATGGDLSGPVASERGVINERGWPVECVMCGAEDHEAFMVRQLRKDQDDVDGKICAWYLWPGGTPATEIALFSEEGTQEMNSKAENEARTTYNFILLDGTWSNAKAMGRRLEKISKSAGVRMEACSINPAAPSAFAKLRKQPHLSKVSTTGAGVQLLRELAKRDEGCKISQQLLATSHHLEEQLIQLTMHSMKFVPDCAAEHRFGAVEARKIAHVQW